jgi:hypothetical protein
MFRTPRSTAAPPPRQLSRAAWEQEMRRLRLSNRLLGIVLLAIVTKGIISGPQLIEFVVGATTALLLLASLALSRQGRRLEPHAKPAEQSVGREPGSAGPMSSIREPRPGTRGRA